MKRGSPQPQPSPNPHEPSSILSILSQYVMQGECSNVIGVGVA